jgi:hypothetical protein
MYLREGRRLSRAPSEMGSLRSDFTSCGSAPSAFCPRAAAAIASLPLRRPVAYSVGRVLEVLDYFHVTPCKLLEISKETISEAIWPILLMGWAGPGVVCVLCDGELPTWTGGDGCSGRRRQRRGSESGGGRADSAGGAVYLQPPPAHGAVLPRAGLCPLLPSPPPFDLVYVQFCVISISFC